MARDRLSALNLLASADAKGDGVEVSGGNENELPVNIDGGDAVPNGGSSVLTGGVVVVGEHEGLP